MTDKLTATFMPGAPADAPVLPIAETHNGWTVTLRWRGRTMTTPYYTGAAIENPTKVEDVMECLLMDALGVETTQSFEEWAPEYGYDPDSRFAEKIYRAVCEQTDALRDFLGDDYEDALSDGWVEDHI